MNTDAVATRKVLEIMVAKWEGGEVVDTNYLIRELVKVFREAEAARRIDDVI